MNKQFRPFILLLIVILIKNYLILGPLYKPYIERDMPYIESSHKHQDYLHDLESSIEITQKDDIVYYKETQTFKVNNEHLNELRLTASENGFNSKVILNGMTVAANTQVLPADKPFSASGKRMTVDYLATRSLKAELLPEPMIYKYPMKLTVGNYEVVIEKAFKMEVYLDHFLIPTKYFMFKTKEGTPVTILTSAFTKENDGIYILAKPWLKLIYNPHTILFNLVIIVLFYRLYRQKTIAGTQALAFSYLFLLPVRIADDYFLFTLLQSALVAIFIFERFFTANR